MALENEAIAAGRATTASFSAAVDTTRDSVTLRALRSQHNPTHIRVVGGLI